MKSIRIIWAIAMLLIAAALLWVVSGHAAAGSLLQREISVRTAADAAGLAAYFALWAGCCLGLLVSSPPAFLPVRWTGSGAHAGVLTLALLLGMLHPLLLLCYPGSTLRVYQIFLPFTAPYHPVLYGLGTLAFYGMLLLAFSGAWRLPRRHPFWKGIHLCAYPVYLAALAHAILGGPHAGDPVYYGLYAVTCILLLALVLRQLYSGKSLENS